MSSIEERIAALEAEIQVIREEAAAARALAAGADRDVADYRAEMRNQTRLISSLRETQVEHGLAIGLLGSATRELQELTQAGFQAIGDKLDTLIATDGDSA